MISQEKINLNYTRWVERLVKYNCHSQRMLDEIGDKIRDASFALQESSGCAYQGSMLDVVLNSLCTLAYHINENAFGDDGKGRLKHPRLKTNPKMLMRVLLLQHIAKAEMFIPQPVAWRLKNGYIYDFNDSLGSCLKCGERSLYMCMKYGIGLSEEEYEAMRVIDKEEDKPNPFISPLCYMVKAVNQMVSIEYRQNFLLNKKQQEKLEQ